MKYLLPASLLIIFFCLSEPARAETMSGNNLNVQIEQITPVPQPTAAVQTLPKANMLEGQGYTVDETDATSLLVQSSSDVADFGLLSPTDPLLRTFTLSLFNPYYQGITVLAFENHPLMASNSATIADTTCDNGQCSQTNASSWTSELTYGFGYRCDGEACADGFEQPTDFKQFPDQSNNELPQAIIQEQRFTNPTTRLTYKVNVSGTQDTTFPYQNIVTFLAVPKL